MPIFNGGRIGSNNVPFTGTKSNDPNYSNVSLLLNGNGTNGSTTFTDSSNNSHTVTANGNAQISTTQSKFGGASMYFDGSGDYLSLASSSDFEFSTGDFTVEFWYYHISGNDRGLFANNSGASVGVNFLVGVGGPFRIYNGTSANNLYDFSASPTANTWQHLAVVRNSGTLTLYVNGISSGSTNWSGVNAGNTATFSVGSAFGNARYANGFIDDLRITKGVARYTANFTPPTAELYLSTTETQQAPVLTDISLNNNTATLYNGVGYTSSNLGYFTFDGTNDYMEIPYDESVNLTDGDFTIDFWMNSFADQTSDVLVSYGNTSNVGGWAIKTATNKLQYSVGFATHPAVAGIVTSGLVVHLDAGNSNSYPGSGTTWTDLTGNGNNGTLVNGVGFDSDNGGSLSFDGVNDYVQVSNNNGFGEVSTTPTITLEGWANVARKPPTGFDVQQFFGFRNQSNFDFYFALIDTGGADVTTEARIRTASLLWDINVSYISYFNKWTYICFVANVTRTDLYFNGNLVGSNTSVTGSFGSTSGNFRIGLSPQNIWPTLGNISSVKVYNRALSASEVQQNFNALRGRFSI